MIDPAKVAVVWIRVLQLRKPPGRYRSEFVGWAAPIQPTKVLDLIAACLIALELAADGVLPAVYIPWVSWLLRFSSQSYLRRHVQVDGQLRLRQAPADYGPVHTKVHASVNEVEVHQRVEEMTVVQQDPAAPQVL